MPWLNFHVRNELNLITFLGRRISIGFVASIASNAGVCVSEGKLSHSADFFNGAVKVVIDNPVDGVIEHVPGAIISKVSPFSPLFERRRIFSRISRVL
jgi:hypothetical protein